MLPDVTRKQKAKLKKNKWAGLRKEYYMSAMFKTPFSTMWWLGVPLMFFWAVHIYMYPFSIFPNVFYQESCWCYLTSQVFCMLCGPVVVTTVGGRGVDVHNTAIIKSRHNCTVVFTSRKWETGFVSIQKSNFTLQFSCQVLHTGLVITLCASLKRLFSSP